MPRSSHFLLASISVLALGACSGSSDTRQAKSDAPMPPIGGIDSAMSEPAPQSLSGSDTLTPVMATASAGGMEERMARLEQSVGALQSDYQRIAPAFATLNTTNERIQMLLSQIENETGIKSTVASAPAAPATTSVTEKTTTTTAMMPAPAAAAKTVIPAPGTVSKANDVVLTQTVTTTVENETAEASAPPLSAFKNQPSPDEAKAEAARQAAISSAAGTKAPIQAIAGANSVKGVRVGEHGAKTRVVFDLTGGAKPEFKYDIDSTEKLLVVEMPGSNWTGAATGTPKSPMIESWAAQETPSGGSTVAIQLKKGARVLSSEYLKAEGTSPARLVMDIGVDG